MSENGDLEETARRVSPCQLPSGEQLTFKTSILKGKYWGELDITARHQPPNSTEVIDIGWCRGFVFTREAALHFGWNFGRHGQRIPRHAQSFLKCAFDASGQLKHGIVEVEDVDTEDSDDDGQVMPGPGTRNRRTVDTNSTLQESTASTYPPQQGESSTGTTPSTAANSTQEQDHGTENDEIPYLFERSITGRTPTTNIQHIGNHSFLIILHLAVDINWRRKGIAMRMCNIMNRLALIRCDTLKFAVVWPLGVAGDHDLTPEMEAEGLGPDHLAGVAQSTAKSFYHFMGFVPLGMSRWYVRNLDDVRISMEIDQQRTPQERARRARQVPNLAIRMAVQMANHERARQQVHPVVDQQTNPSDGENPRVISVSQLLNEVPPQQQTQTVQVQPANRPIKQSANLQQHQMPTAQTPPANYPGRQLPQHRNHVSPYHSMQTMQTQPANQPGRQWTNLPQNQSQAIQTQPGQQLTQHHNQVSQQPQMQTMQAQPMSQPGQQLTNLQQNQMQAMQTQPASQQQDPLEGLRASLQATIETSVVENLQANLWERIETNIEANLRANLQTDIQTHVQAALRANPVFQDRNNDVLPQQEMQHMQAQPGDRFVQQGSDIYMLQYTPPSSPPVQFDEDDEFSDYNIPSSHESMIFESDGEYHSMEEPHTNNPHNVFSDPEERRLASIGDEQTFGDFWAYWVGTDEEFDAVGYN